MLRPCLRQGTRASSLASTSKLTIEQSTTIDRSANRQRYASAATEPVSRREAPPPSRPAPPHHDHTSSPHSGTWKKKRAQGMGVLPEFLWVLDGLSSTRPPPAPSTGKEEPPDPFLEGLLARHDHAAALKYTDEALAAGMHSVSPSFLAARLEAILALSAFDRLPSIASLFDSCSPPPQEHHYSLWMQAYLAASNVEAAKDVYRRAINRGFGRSFETQRRLVLGFKQARSGAGMLRRMMMFAFRGQKHEGFPDLLAAWMEIYLQHERYDQAQGLLRKFDWQGHVVIPWATRYKATRPRSDEPEPDLPQDGRSKAEAPRSEKELLHPTLPVCIAAMKLYNAVEAPQMVQAIWQALPSLGLQPDSASLVEVLKSADITESLRVIEQLPVEMLTPEVFAPLLPAIRARYGIEAFDTLLSWMRAASVRPTPAFLAEALEAFTLEPGLTPKQLAEACLAAHKASEGALVLSDDHAWVVLRFAVDWAEKRWFNEDRLRRTMPRRTQPAEDGMKPVFALRRGQGLVSREATVDRLGTGRRGFRAVGPQTVWIEQLREAHHRADTLHRPPLDSVVLDPEDPDLGLGSIMKVLELCYPNSEVNPSNRVTGAMMRLAALTGRRAEDVYAILDEKVLAKELTPDQSHLRAVALASLVKEVDSEAVGRAFSQVSETARRSRVFFAGTVLAVFVTALIAARQPLAALAIFAQAESLDTPENRLSPEAYVAATSAAAAAGDVDLMRKLHTEMKDRFPDRAPRSEALYFTTLFEALMRLQEPQEAQDEAMRALTCGLTPDEKVMKVIVDSGKKLRKTVRRLQRVRASLIEGGAVPAEDAVVPASQQMPGAGGVDRQKYSWQLQHVERRLVSLNQALELQGRVEVLAMQKMLDRELPPPPVEADRGAAVARIAGRIGDFARVPSWFQWQMEKKEIEERGGVRKPLYGPLEEALEARREARSKTVTVAA